VTIPELTPEEKERERHKNEEREHVMKEIRDVIMTKDEE
jgi:hypothetical protein